jgi:hypothetical protein
MSRSEKFQQLVGKSTEQLDLTPQEVVAYTHIVRALITPPDPEEKLDSKDEELRFREKMHESGVSYDVYDELGNIVDFFLWPILNNLGATYVDGSEGIDLRGCNVDQIDLTKYKTRLDRVRQ